MPLSVQQVQWLVSAVNVVVKGSGYTVYAFTKPIRLKLGYPISYRNGEIIVASYNLGNDLIVGFPILEANAAGVSVPAVSGDTYQVVSNNPASLQAVIGLAGDPPVSAVLVNALVANSPSVSFTLTDTAGLTPFTQTISIVADASPSQMAEGGAIVVGSQAVPTNPGP